ncbi:LysR family transcriptional regulator [Polaromonas sp. P1(28)-8]|nr:LysR family transcriptional regulator [Polaromonas sp. P1(28)-8]
MNFKQIETFRAVMLTGSMTVAAQQLHTSQPNVSRGIGKLEAEIGFELFDRLAGRLVATKGGEALFKEVERVRWTGQSHRISALFGSWGWEPSALPQLPRSL